MSQNKPQNTVRYEETLKHAIEVFGHQTLAEIWLNQPCKYLQGNMPLDLIYSSLGLKSVEDYLIRIEHGVYQ